MCTIPVLAVSFSNMVFANAMQNSEIMTKVKQFIQDGTSTLMILTPILGGLILGILGIIFMANGNDEIQQQKTKKSITRVLFAVAFVEICSALANLVSSYFM